MLPELIPLLERLCTSRVDFVVIGGVAVTAHGLVRATKDLDIVPAPTQDNLLALGNLLIDLDARTAASPDVPFGAEHHGRSPRRVLGSTRVGEDARTPDDVGLIAASSARPNSPKLGEAERRTPN